MTQSLFLSLSMALLMLPGSSLQPPFNETRQAGLAPDYIVSGWLDNAEVVS